MAGKGSIIATIACFLAISCTYEFVVERGLLDRFITMDSQWETNTAWAERYMYQASDREVVIVGSSLSQRIINRLLPRNMINIAMAGQSALDGLSIIDHIQSHPKVVLVETNALTVGEKKSFIDGLFGGPWYEVRRRWFSLREVYRPMGVSEGVARSISMEVQQLLSAPHQTVRESSLKAVAPTTQKASVSASPVRAARTQGLSAQETRMQRSLKRFQQSYATPPDQREFAANMRTLEKYVHTLEARGIQVIFFEMPTHPSLCTSTYLKFVRAQVHEHFPSHHYVRDSDCARYEVTDGLHLTPASAFRFALGLFHSLKTAADNKDRELRHRELAVPSPGRHSGI